MKKYSIRLNVLQGQWLHTEAESRGLKISEVVRSVLETQQRSRAFSRARRTLKTGCSELELALVRTTALSYQLLESLLLNEDRESKRYHAAVASAEEHLAEMGIQGKLLKSYYLSVWLSPAQSEWLEKEALQGSKRASQVLEDILRWAFEDRREASLSVHPVQQEQLRFLLRMCALLEQHIVEHYENGAELMDKVKQKIDRLAEEWIENPERATPLLR
jgi:hypothetical protein